MELWTEKYKPKNANELVGNKEALVLLKKYIETYKKNKKAILICGPSGIGKNLAIEILANELNYELIELNASDARNKANINSILGEANKQRSLFGKGKIILIDEVDGISGIDRGFTNAILDLIEKSNYPIIMITNDIGPPAISQLKRKSILIKFEPISVNEIYNFLSKIAKSESVKMDDSLIKSLAYRSGGDVRGAITDLQSLSLQKEIKKEDVEKLDSRKQTELITNALLKIFKTSDLNIASSAFDNISEDIDECILWLDENIPHEYQKADDLARAYDALSLADVYRGRILKRQHWRFLVYTSSFSTSGIALAKERKYENLTKYKRSSRILNLWIAKLRYNNRNSIAEKLAAKLHKSKKSITKNYIPYLKIIFKENKEMGKNISKEYELEDDEINWLNK